MSGDHSVSNIRRCLRYADHGTLITDGGKAIVFMPLWFYALALTLFLGFGLLVGAVYL